MLSVDAQLAELTEDEEKEFDIFNFVAYDTLLGTARRKGEKIPLWLCMSKEAKDAARKTVIDMLSRHIILPDLSQAGVNLSINQLSSGKYNSRIEDWKNVERERKFHRDNGDPLAYFV